MIKNLKNLCNRFNFRDHFPKDDKNLPDYVKSQFQQKIDRIPEMTFKEFEALNTKALENRAIFEKYKDFTDYFKQITTSYEEFSNQKSIVFNLQEFFTILVSSATYEETKKAAEFFYNFHKDILEGKEKVKTIFQPKDRFFARISPIKCKIIIIKV